MCVTVLRLFLGSEEAGMQATSNQWYNLEANQMPYLALLKRILQWLPCPKPLRGFPTQSSKCYFLFPIPSVDSIQTACVDGVASMLAKVHV